MIGCYDKVKILDNDYRSLDYFYSYFIYPVLSNRNSLTLEQCIDNPETAGRHTCLFSFICIETVQLYLLKNNLHIYALLPGKIELTIPVCVCTGTVHCDGYDYSYPVELCIAMPRLAPLKVCAGIHFFF